MPLDFSPVWNGAGALLHGAAVTLAVTVAAMLLSCALGLLAGIARLDRRRRVIYAVASLYLLFIRGTPLLVQLFLLFFGLPQFGIMLPAFVCAVIGLGLYSGAYVSEIVRGAIQSVDVGQMEAARTLGLTRAQAMRLVILPQAALRAIPPLGNEAIALIKNSALVSLLTISDLMHEGEEIISVSYRSLEVYLAVALLYLAMTSAAGAGLRAIERRLRHGGLLR
jgi:polar amino acid transport system permease protein